MWRLKRRGTRANDLGKKSIPVRCMLSLLPGQSSVFLFSSFGLFAAALLLLLFKTSHKAKGKEKKEQKKRSRRKAVIVGASSAEAIIHCCMCHCSCLGCIRADIRAAALSLLLAAVRQKDCSINALLLIVRFALFTALCLLTICQWRKTSDNTVRSCCFNSIVSSFNHSCKLWRSAVAFHYSSSLPACRQAGCGYKAAAALLASR